MYEVFARENFEGNFFLSLICVIFGCDLKKKSDYGWCALLKLKVIINRSGRLWF